MRIFKKARDKDLVLADCRSFARNRLQPPFCERSSEDSAGSPGWVLKLDRKSGKILGYVPVRENAGLHSIEDACEGQPMTDVGNRVVW